MPNSFDHGGRGPSNSRLFVAGVAFALTVCVLTALMIAKYQGRLDPIVRVTAELTNVGDGLPAKSDVKFRGVLVGFVGLYLLGSLSGSPQWLLDLGPFAHTPRVGADFTATPLLWLLAIDGLLIALGAIGFRRRDVR